MRAFLPLLVVTSCLIRRSASACDELWCPLEYAADAAGFGLGAGTWLIDNVKGLFDQPEPAPQATIHPVDNTAANKDRSDIETMTAMPPLGQNQCEAPAQQSDQDQNQVSHEFLECFDFAQAIVLETTHDISQVIPGIRSCERTSPMLVWTRNCQARQANAAVASMLWVMDSGFSTSVAPFCPDTGGELFWLARLSLQQAETVRQQTTTVQLLWQIPNTTWPSLGPPLRRRCGLIFLLKERELAAQKNLDRGRKCGLRSVPPKL